MKTLKFILFVFPLFFVLQSSTCQRVQYNQTGQGGRDWKEDTVSATVMQFTSSAPLAKPTLAQTMTESLKDFIVGRTRITLLPEDGDLIFEGDIVGYNIAPVAITAGTTDQAAYNRLTITVKVKYTDNIDPNFSFESNFARFADFPSTTDISAVEDQLIKEITDQITQDIINKSIYAW